MLVLKKSKQTMKMKQEQNCALSLHALMLALTEFYLVTVRQTKLFCCISSTTNRDQFSLTFTARKLNLWRRVRKLWTAC